MTKIIKSEKDLNKLLKQVAYKMLSQTRDKIYDAIQDSIKEYYSEYKPSVYKRTYRFLNSLVKTKIKQRGNELWCEVKIDEDYLKYTYPTTKAFKPSYPDQYESGGGRFAQGIDVVNWANRQYPDDDEEGSNHGYTVNAGREEGFWDDSLDELGDIMILLKKNLKNQGINIT